MRVNKGRYLNFQLPILPTQSLKEGNHGNDVFMTQSCGEVVSSGRSVPRTEQNRIVCTEMGLSEHLLSREGGDLGPKPH